MKRARRNLCLFWTILGICLFQAPVAPAAEKISLILNWVPVGYHAGFFVARDKGYYAEEGLEVDIIGGKGSGLAVKSVATGTANMGMADAGTVVAGRSQGLKVRMVGMFFDRSPMVIFVLKGSGIKGPKDLPGRTLAAPVASAPRVLFPAFARANGISVDSVKWLTTVPAVLPITLATKQVEGIADFSTAWPNFERAAREKGLELEMIRYADHGLDIFGLSLISGDKWIQNNPKLLKAFLKGTYRGIRWVIKDPSDGINILLKSHPALGRSASLERWHIAQDLMLTPVSRKQGLGYMAPDKVKLLRDTITKYMDVKGSVATEDLYTNEFLPRVYPPK
ncbi:MAG: ABC transporter substrate-binding protein [Candidatus Tectomicrobia bacterium]|nr:ABC transporter substrate-binding protein [Candidatus Tectomicrobia bacterium]